MRSVQLSYAELIERHFPTARQLHTITVRRTTNLPRLTDKQRRQTRIFDPSVIVVQSRSCLKPVVLKVGRTVVCCSPNMSGSVALNTPFPSHQ